MIAEVFHGVTAKPAISINPAHPGDSDAGTYRQIRGRVLHHLADDLMTGNHAWPEGWQISFDDVQIRAAHAACNYLQQDFSRLQGGPRNLLDRQPFFAIARPGFEDGCSHRASPFPV